MKRLKDSDCLEHRLFSDKGLQYYIPSLRTSQRIVLVPATGVIVV